MTLEDLNQAYCFTKTAMTNNGVDKLTSGFMEINSN